MKFLLQEVNGRLVYDFAYKMLDGIQVANELHNANIQVEICEKVPKNFDFKDYVPIGSLEFVYDFLATHHGIDVSFIKPINIPSELRKDEYLKRNVVFTDTPSTKGKFIKSHTQYKGLVTIYEGQELPEDTYMESDYVNIVAEFRVFIMQGLILDVRRYCGEIFRLPDETLIKSMVAEYKDAPLSYTLDVGITSDDATIILEVHPFVSCGLYGFNLEYYLPYMSYQGFKWLKTEAQREMEEKTK